MMTTTATLLTLDRDPKGGPRGKTPTSRAERQYAKSLRDVAKHVGTIISGYTPSDIKLVPSLLNLLDKYAEALTPWAERTATRMLAEVNDRDREAWRRLGNSISVGLRDLILGAPVGNKMREILGEQVTLIKSIPTEAGRRVHELTLAGLESSARAKEIATEIARSSDVAESRAILIARTEVSRTAEILLETRAVHAGSEGYIWETSRDGAVRPSHRAMQGKFVYWRSPPTLDKLTGHAGCTPNCRCWTRVVLPE